MLTFWFKFLRPHYFLTLQPIWFIFGLTKILHSAIPTPYPHPLPHHVKIKVTDRIFQKQNVQYQASDTVWRQVDLKVTQILPMKLESFGLSLKEKYFKLDFQDGCHGGHLGFPVRTFLAFFDIHVTPILPSKFWVNWTFSSGEEVHNSFSRWQPWRPSCISDRNDFSYFWFNNYPDTSYQVSSLLAFLLGRWSSKQTVKMAAVAAMLDFWWKRF